jgi:hypothetical protein
MAPAMVNAPAPVEKEVKCCIFVNIPMGMTILLVIEVFYIISFFILMILAILAGIAANEASEFNSSNNVTPTSTRLLLAYPT